MAHALAVLHLNNHLKENLNMSVANAEGETLFPETFTQSISKDQIAALPFYSSNRNVFQPMPGDVGHCLQDIMQEKYVGFDTESKPAFKRSQSRELALIQISTAKAVYLFNLEEIGSSISDVAKVLSSKDIVKVGFGLEDDRKLLNELCISQNGFLDLAGLFKQVGRKSTLGAKQAVGLLLSKQLKKAPSVSKSNWSVLPYSNAQKRYAAEDAAAPFDCYTALQDEIVHFYKERGLAYPEELNGLFPADHLRQG